MCRRHEGRAKQATQQSMLFTAMATVVSSQCTCPGSRAPTTCCMSQRMKHRQNPFKYLHLNAFCLCFTRCDAQCYIICVQLWHVNGTWCLQAWQGQGDEESDEDNATEHAASQQESTSASSQQAGAGGISQQTERSQNQRDLNHKVSLPPSSSL